MAKSSKPTGTNSKKKPKGVTLGPTSCKLSKMYTQSHVDLGKKV